jgi:hypothetical protein
LTFHHLFLDVNSIEIEDNENEDDEEFVGEDELDDESTLIEAEAEGAGKSSAEELATLKAESEMSIDQLRAIYANMGEMSDDSEGYMSEGSDDGEIKIKQIDSVKSDIRNMVDKNGKTSSPDSPMSLIENGINTDGNHDDEDDEEFVGEEELDDESTLIEAEAEGAGKSSAEELATLKAESEMSIDQLRAMYANMGEMSDDSEGYPSGDDEDDDVEVKVETTVNSVRPSRQSTSSKSAKPPISTASSDDVSDNVGDFGEDGGGDNDDDEEFVGEDELDDESTLIEAEAEGSGKSSAEELATLKAESEMSIDQLRAIYANMGEMSDDSEGYMSEGSDEGEQQETNHTCTTVALSPASEKQNADENLDVDGAMERLEKADMQARSIHVSVCVSCTSNCFENNFFFSGGLSLHFVEKIIPSRVPACRFKLAGIIT